MGIRINGSSGGYVEIGVPANPSNRNITLPDTDGEALVGTTNGAVVLPSGNTLQRPTGAAGQIRFNTDTGKMEYFSSTSDTPQWLSIQDSPINITAVEYLVVGGGGAGSGYDSAAYWDGDDGDSSIFSTFTAGGGAGGVSVSAPSGGVARNGLATNGSGGGGGYSTVGGTGDGTGGNGGNGYSNTSYGAYNGGGGGGAGANGGNGSLNFGGDGGDGVISTIITTTQATAQSVGEVVGSDVWFGGGGSGGVYAVYTGNTGAGGKGGGSILGSPVSFYSPNNTCNGDPNTGGGGAGNANGAAGGGGGGGGGVLTGTLNISTGVATDIKVGDGGAAHQGSGSYNISGGGSGVVILKYPATKTATFSSGVTQTTITDGSNKISFVTGTQNAVKTVTFG